MSKKETGNPTPKRKQANKSPVVVTRLNDDDLAALDIVTCLQPINSDHQRRIAKCLFETIMQDVSSTTKHCADFRRAIRRAGGRCSNMAAYGWLNATTAAQYGVPLVQRYVALWAATSSPS